MPSSSGQGRNFRQVTAQGNPAQMIADDDNDSIQLPEGYGSVADIIRRLRKQPQRHASDSSLDVDDFDFIEIIERDEAEVDEQEQRVIDLTTEDDVAPSLSKLKPPRASRHPQAVYCADGIDLRLGDLVELREAIGPFRVQFLEIKEIWAHDGTSEMTLHGIPYTRARNLSGRLETKRNELCEIMEIVNSAREPEEEQALFKIVASQILTVRDFNKTNAMYPLRRFGNNTMWTMRSSVEKEEQAPLTCRWKMRAEYADPQHRKAVRAYGIAFTHLSEDEVFDPLYRIHDSGKLKRWLGRNPKTPVRVEYTVGDAFCGAGGASRGARMAGLKVTIAIDHWSVACQTYRRNFPDTRLYDEDVTDFINNNTACCVDILHISPPCQFFSPAHTHAGRNDGANIAALFACAELIKKMRPRLVTLEQTYGLTHDRHAPFFNALIQAFTSNGYSVQWRIVPLVNYGLPQTRKRLIMIGAAPGSKLPPWPPATHGPGLKPFVTEAKAIDRMPRNATLHDIHSVRRVNNLARRSDVPLPRTITCSGPDGMVHYSGLRDYTLRELACLQGFPAGHVFQGHCRGAIKKQIGNAFPPCVVHVIYRHLRSWLEEQDGQDGRASGHVLPDSPSEPAVRQSCNPYNGILDEDTALELALQESRSVMSAPSAELQSSQCGPRTGRDKQLKPRAAAPIVVVDISNDEAELPARMDHLSVGPATSPSSRASSVTFDFSRPSSPSSEVKRKELDLSAGLSNGWKKQRIRDDVLDRRDDFEEVQFLYEVRKVGIEGLEESTAFFGREPSVPSCHEGNRMLSFSKKLQKLPVNAEDDQSWSI